MPALDAEIWVLLSLHEDDTLVLELEQWWIKMFGGAGQGECILG